jgi:hypothetical protein
MPGFVEPFERRGVDVPPVEVVLRAKAVQQKDRMRPAAREFDADVASIDGDGTSSCSIGRPSREYAAACGGASTTATTVVNAAVP